MSCACGEPTVAQPFCLANPLPSSRTNASGRLAANKGQVVVPLCTSCVNGEERSCSASLHLGVALRPAVQASHPQASLMKCQGPQLGPNCCHYLRLAFVLLEHLTHFHSLLDRSGPKN